MNEELRLFAVKVLLKDFIDRHSMWLVYLLKSLRDFFSSAHVVIMHMEGTQA